MNTLFVQKLTDWAAARPHWLLAGHLLILHILAFGGWQSVTVRLLMPVAVGLVLLWQPFVEGERRLNWRQAGLLLLLVLALAQWLNPWWMLVWVGTLAATVGGRVLWTSVRRERWGYLIVFGYLLALMVLALVPGIAAGTVALEPWSIEWAGRLVWALIPLFVVVMPARADVPPGRDAFDFFYAVLVFLLLAAFVLGALAFMLVARVSYLEAVIVTSLVLAGALLLLAWVWNPQAGVAGWSSFFSRYLLSLGMPLEQWLTVLNEEAERHDDPEVFLQAALARMLDRPWLIGAVWQANGREGECGRRSPYSLAADFDTVRFQLFLRHAPSPSMRWHLNWLLRLTAEVYLIKRQARELQRIGYIRAVYETGARVTHDVKNLLQALQTLCYAATQPGEPVAIAQLLGRQLPQIAERLKSTLDKLQNPEATAITSQRAEDWWEALNQRYAGEAIVWESDVAPDIALPRELFDSAAENLLQNALFKRQQSVGLPVRVSLRQGAGGAELSVQDGGDALPEELARRLFLEPLPSAQGLGIGLYHVARLAGELHYRLELADNRAGCVRFYLSPD